MPRSSRQISATTAFEIEVSLTGTFQPGCPERGPTYSSGGEPAEAAGMEDVEVEGLTGIQFRGPESNLLAGVDRKNHEVRKLLDNILSFLGEQADEALLVEVSE